MPKKERILEARRRIRGNRGCRAASNIGGRDADDHVSDAQKRGVMMAHDVVPVSQGKSRMN